MAAPFVIVQGVRCTRTILRPAGVCAGLYFISADASASRRSPRQRMPCFVTRSARATVDFFRKYKDTWHKRAT